MLLFNHNASFPLMTCSILGNGSNNSMHSEFSFFSLSFFFLTVAKKIKVGAVESDTVENEYSSCFFCCVTRSH